MQTYIAPIGYDTRRVTRPVVHNGVGGDDTVVLLRPADESDTDRAHQTIADVEQLLQEIEPAVTITVERVPVADFEDAILTCCEYIVAARGDRIISLGGGARDVLLPLLIASLVHADDVASALFFSDLDHSVREWALPLLQTKPPTKVSKTMDELLAAEEPLSLSALADRTDLSKSTVVRHVNELEEQRIVESTREGKTKRVEVSFSGKLVSRSWR